MKKQGAVHFRMTFSKNSTCFATTLKSLTGEANSSDCLVMMAPVKEWDILATGHGAMEKGDLVCCIMISFTSCGWLARHLPGEDALWEEGKPADTV